MENALKKPDISNTWLDDLLTRINLIAVTISCPKHGAVTTYAKSAELATCHLCQQEQEQAQRQREIAQHRWQHRLKAANIGRRFTHCRLSDLAELADYSLITQYVEHFAQNDDGAGVVLYGSVGTGKTYVGCAIALALLADGFSIYYDTIYQMLQTIRATWNGGELTTEQAIQRYVSPDLLILDEIGVQYGTANEQMLIFDIINRRSADCRPIIAISNLPPSEFKKFMGERAYDRLFGYGALILELRGPSRR
jgi:DNA replication protein DnaC